MHMATLWKYANSRYTPQPHADFSQNLPRINEITKSLANKSLSIQHVNNAMQFLILPPSISCSTQSTSKILTCIGLDKLTGSC
uniref:Uncharacterized protein n=1 Tax=Rhizophora mucronata TaxID=61149 RepID=A0A2P2PLQ3_RHIMU